MQDWLSGLDIKYYETKINLNWKPILKSIIEVFAPSATISAVTDTPRISKIPMCLYQSTELDQPCIHACKAIKYECKYPALLQVGPALRIDLHWNAQYCEPAFHLPTKSFEE